MNDSNRPSTAADLQARRERGMRILSQMNKEIHRNAKRKAATPRFSWLRRFVSRARRGFREHRRDV